MSDRTILEPGSKLDGRIEVLELIGHGAMGVVYKAKQQGVERAVAIKTLHATALNNREQLGRFFREAKVISALDHPNIVKMYAFGMAEDRQPYMVMDYVEGMTLADVIAANKLTAEQYLDVFIQVARALDHAHRNDVVHRDIKPRNILIQESSDGNYVVKLADFGIARLTQSDAGPAQKLTQTGSIIGSPAYMSPEQCIGNAIDSRSDLYSLGCVMYQAATGEHVFHDEQAVALISKHLLDEPPSARDRLRVPGLPASIAKVISVLLAKKPEDRYKDAQVLIDDLTAIRNKSEPPFASQTSLPAHPQPAKLHKQSKIVILSVVLASIVMVGSFFVARTLASGTKEQEISATDRANLDDIRVRAASLMSHRQYTEALSLYSNAYDYCVSHNIKGKTIADICAGRARCSLEIGNFQNARRFFTIASDYYKTFEPSNKRVIAQLAADWGTAELRTGGYESASSLFAEAWKLTENSHDMDTNGKIRMLDNYCQALDGVGNYARSTLLYPKLLEMREKRGTVPERLAETHEHFANALENLDRQTEAEHERKLALNLRRKTRLDEDKSLVD